MTSPTIVAARRCARWYRRLGYQPLPSRVLEKRPDLHAYAIYWEVPVPEWVLGPGWQVSNVQLMTGARWSLGVVDLDGPPAVAAWRTLAREHGGHEPTWMVRTGGGGLHLYFTLPDGCTACRTRRLWGVWDPDRGPAGRGDWTPRCEIRLLGDHSLVVAPPSRHVRPPHNPYRFVAGRSPHDQPRPAVAPDWLIALPEVRAPRPAFNPICLTRTGNPTRMGKPSGPGPDRNAVLEALGPEKHHIALGHGLRLAGSKPNPQGWVRCHAIDREDRHPSASIHSESGVYVDFVTCTRMSFFDLLAELDPQYPTWRDALLGINPGLPAPPRKTPRFPSGNPDKGCQNPLRNQTS